MPAARALRLALTPEDGIASFHRLVDLAEDLFKRLREQVVALVGRQDDEDAVRCEGVVRLLDHVEFQSALTAQQHGVKPRLYRRGQVP